MADASIIIQKSSTSAIDPSAGVISRQISARPFRVAVVASALAGIDATAAVIASLAIMAIAAWIGIAIDVPWYALSILAVTFGGLLGLYTAAGPSPFERFRLRVIASSCAAGLLIFISEPLEWHDSFVLVPFKAALLIVLGHYAEAALRFAFMRAKLWCAPTIVVNDNDKGRQIATALLSRPDIGLSPIGFVHSPDHNAASTDAGSSLPLVGTTADLGRLGAEVAIFTSSQELAKVFSQQRIGSPLPRLLLFENTAEIGSLWLRPRMLGDSIGIEVQSNQDRRGGRTVKRLMDLLLVTPLAIVALPIVLVTALLIVLINPGPAFYQQERIGRHGRPIRVLKLRSMYRNSEERLREHLQNNPDARAEWDRYFKLFDDPRILPLIGRFIRMSSIDELPQLWNVLKGEMSLVGPRPFPAYHMQAFDPEFQALRTSVQPGLTGLWQISARSNGDISIQKSQDLFYIRNRSLWLDLYILLQTVPAVLFGNGAR